VQVGQGGMALARVALEHVPRARSRLDAHQASHEHAAHAAGLGHVQLVSGDGELSVLDDPQSVTRAGPAKPAVAILAPDGSQHLRAP
jgi:hypothetical protein